MDHIVFPQDRLEQATAYTGLSLARVVSQHKNLYSVMTTEGKKDAELPGSYLYTVRGSEDYPAVGDYVLIDDATQGGHAIIHKLLERNSVFARKAAGETDEQQIIAANVDTLFLCMALNQDFNLRRLERYLAIAWESGAEPVIILTKADLCDDLKAKQEHVQQALTETVPVFTTSITKEAANDGWKSLVLPGKTVAFVGSSGVGKSTLINQLLDNATIATSGIRDDGKGRHTTTRRDLYVVPSGAMVIDTPGMRELGLSNADVGKTFGEIETIAAHCRFADCSHNQEPGCAVREALDNGEILPERLESYRKLIKEAGYEGMNSKQIEQAKIATMYTEFGGIKNAQKYIKSKRSHS